MSVCSLHARWACSFLKEIYTPPFFMKSTNLFVLLLSLVILPIAGCGGGADTAVDRTPVSEAEMDPDYHGPDAEAAESEDVDY